MLTTTNHAGRKPLHARLCRVRIRLCGKQCKLCPHGHAFTEPMDAERLDYDRVKITQPDDIWFNAVVSSTDYEFVA